MAVRPQHMHDGSILERRLRPIYDWLDNGNNKKALQEAEKVLKKSNRLQSARALKALALFRLGRAAEAQALLDALAEEKPSDENTLQAMTISYRESQQLHKVCSLYETAIKTEPTSEELHSHLFMSYVRVGDYLSQQRAAMALYKLTPKNPYYFWAVMSIVLQAKSTNENTKRGILLTLAQRMIDNFISDNKMEAEQEARLYIMILELQEKWEDILKFIEGPLYTKLVPGSAPQSFIPYLKKLGHWRRLNIVCKELLWENQDRWDYYLPYFDSVFELMKVKEPDAEGSVDDTAEKAHEFICQLVESMSSGKTLRGPYLARLELWKRLNKDPSAPDPTMLLGSGIALCLQYLRVFAHKPCAVPDLRQYLAMLPKKEREEHSREFLTCLGFDENSEPETSDDIQRHISCLCAWRLTAPPLEACACATLARTLRRDYLRCAQRGLITATITEFCSPDSYAILAAHHYFYLAAQQQNSAPIVEALALLEQALENSPANFHIKLLLVKLYHVLGDGEAAESAFACVEAKHVQLVSLGWLHTARLAAVGAPAAALQRLADTRSFHTHHAKDSMEHLTYAYKYGTFEKLCEVMSWNSRLERCAWCALAARDRALLSLLAGPPAPLHAPRPAPANPTDNRDLEVIVGWEPAQCQDPELKARTFEQDVAYLRLKDGLVSSIALCIELSDSRPLNEKRQQYEELKTCVQAFNDAMDKCKDKYSVKEKIGITGPFPSRIIAWVRSAVGYRELYVGALSVVGELAVGGAELRASGEQLAAALRTAAASLSDAVRPSAHCDPRWTARARMEDITNYLEFIGIITYLLGVCNEIITPANAKRNKKKAQQSADDAKNVEMLNKLNEAVQESIATLKEILDEWPKITTIDTIDNTIEEEFTSLNIDKYKSLVIDKLKEGQNKTNLKDILNKKLKYLKTLIQ